MTVALAVLKLAGPLPLVPTGPADPEDIVRQAVKQERERLRDRDASLDALVGLPDYDDHLKTVRKRLAQLASPEDGEGAGAGPDAVTAAPCETDIASTTGIRHGGAVG